MNKWIALPLALYVGSVGAIDKLGSNPNPLVEESYCKKDLECWSQRHKENAKKYCARGFSMRAAASSFWQAYWKGQEFDKVRWISKEKGSLMYYNDDSSAILRCRFYPKTPSRVFVSIGTKKPTKFY
ncbi:hypothetical protein [Neptuniibacter sp. QD34_54]|uniref:hypothetical protein n=1 Tax=Neptuniibacter sp. QD34_54 TaxID=3398208 RepID=UPI0039F4E2A9